MMPSWVEHGVGKVKIEDSDYYDGFEGMQLHILSCKEEVKILNSTYLWYGCSAL